jgi:tripartite-type tricarboxylate transporter receptor subunit TctC
MRISRAISLTISIVLPVLGADAVHAQAWPEKTVRIMATQPGGLTDVVARLLAPGLSANLGRQFVVDNRTALVAVETAAKAPPDGYTILVNGSALWLLPLLRDNITWDPFKDFVPIINATMRPGP